jgi:hypothetical protein
MGLLLVVLFIVGFIWLLVLEAVILHEEGSPVSDKDISDYLDKIEKENLLNCVEIRWNGKYYLNIKHNCWIFETRYSFLFPYYIDRVGVIPIWSKSYSRVRKLFKDNIDNSKYTTTKRKKLGLD